MTLENMHLFCYTMQKDNREDCHAKFGRDSAGR